jgi:hypothetical protein
MSAARTSTERYRRQFYHLAGRTLTDSLTAGELRRIVAVLTEAEDRIAGRKREPARVLQLVAKPVSVGSSTMRS